MQRSDKARKLAKQVRKLLDEEYEQYRFEEPHDGLMARKALRAAADSLLIAAHYFDDREKKEAEAKQAPKFEQTSF